MIRKKKRINFNFLTLYAKVANYPDKRLLSKAKNQESLSDQFHKTINKKQKHYLVTYQNHKPGR